MELNVSYRQFSIFNADIENPFSNWTDKHVEQGFTYRDNIIGIMTINENCNLDIKLNKDSIIYDNSIRGYIFPFSVNSNEVIEVASISDSFQVSIAKGQYSLIIQLQENDKCIISFVDNSIINDNIRIVKADESIKRTNDLILQAEEA